MIKIDTTFTLRELMKLAENSIDLETTYDIYEINNIFKTPQGKAIARQFSRELMRRKGKLLTCTRCDIAGTITVHHIKPLRKGYTKEDILSISNLEAYCRNCHDIEEQTYKSDIKHERIQLINNQDNEEAKLHIMKRIQDLEAEWKAKRR